MIFKQWLIQFKIWNYVKRKRDNKNLYTVLAAVFDLKLGFEHIQ